MKLHEKMAISFDEEQLEILRKLKLLEGKDSVKNTLGIIADGESPYPMLMTKLEMKVVPKNPNEIACMMGLDLNTLTHSLGIGICTFANYIKSTKKEILQSVIEQLEHEIESEEKYGVMTGSDFNDLKLEGAPTFGDRGNDEEMPNVPMNFTMGQA